MTVATQLQNISTETAIFIAITHEKINMAVIQTQIIQIFFLHFKVFVRNIKTMILSKTFDFTLVKTQKLTQNYLEQ